MGVAMNPKISHGRRMFPFLLSFVIIFLDQLTKYWILSTIPLNTVGYRPFGNEFLRIIHVGNNAVAFSIGAGFPQFLKLILFIAIPAVVMGGVVIYVIRSSEFTRLQRWLIAGIIGGGLGNLIDRIFRNGIVVDFIDVKFYGLFGLERFPTFNVADSSIVVCGILLMITLLYAMRKNNE